MSQTHEWYGPCDGFGPRGECSVCTGIIERVGGTHIAYDPLKRCVCGFIHDYGHSVCATLIPPTGLPAYVEGQPQPMRFPTMEGE
jgi:hypothetical protein